MLPWNLKKTKNMASVVDIVVICIFLVVSLVSRGAYSTLHGKRPYNIARGGSSGSLPENTVMAHQMAVQQGTYSLSVCFFVCLSLVPSGSSVENRFILFEVITARVRSTREGNVLTPVCVSVHTFWGGGVPVSVKGKIFDTRFGLIHVQTGKKNFC